MADQKDAFPTEDTLTVIVPVYNEEGHLTSLTEDIAKVLHQSAGEGKWRFLFVDNGSADNSPAEIASICERFPGSKSIRLGSPNYGAALRAGLEQAGTEYAYIINVDFWDAPFLCWAWKNRRQYDLILGSKRADPTINNMPKYRKILTWGLNTLLQLFFGFVGRDTHGQKMVRIPALLPHVQKCVMHRGQFDTEFTLRALKAGLWLAEVPVPITEMRKQRNLMLRKIYNNLKDIIKLRSVMREVPWTHTVRYHRWAREDVLECKRIQLVD